MDRIQIKGLEQGKKKLKNDTYAIGFKTKWGVVWTVMETFPRLFSQSPALEKLFKPFTGAIKEEEFIGRYINVTNKAVEVERDGFVTTVPRL